MTIYANAYYQNCNGIWRYVCNDELVPDANGDVQMNAPELLVHQMLDSHDVAQFLNISPKSVAAMLARNEMPKPQFRVGHGHTPLWARPVIEYWITQRPGKGAHLRNRGKAA